MITAAAIAQALEEIAELLKLKGDNPFKVRAHSNAANLLKNLNSPLEDFIRAVREKKVSGIGDNLREKILTIYETGALPYLDELRSEVPSATRELFEIPGLGAQKVKLLMSELGIASLDDLRRACKQQKVRVLRGFGEKTEAKILKAIDRKNEIAGFALYPHAFSLAKGVHEHFTKLHPGAVVEVVGEVRRRCEVVSSVGLLVGNLDAAECEQALRTAPGVTAITSSGAAHITASSSADVRIDLRVAAPSEFVAMSVYHTGSASHVESLALRARNKGFDFHEFGLNKGDEKLRLSSEADLYNALDLSFIPPELREGRDEAELAHASYLEGKELPRLVEHKDIRGVLHLHTNYSDGTEDLGSFVRALRDQGLEYVGVTDHSRSAIYARGLDVERVLLQQREIEKLNKELAPFRIFKGIESDILKDGSLDYDVEILEKFDFVIASIHSRFGLSGPEMTARVNRALVNPFTTILGHPTGRLLLERDPYAIDMEHILSTAGACGVVVEINSNPRRLDLDWRFHRTARKNGVLLALCPDAHSLKDVSNLAVGAGIARKGGLTAEEIITCWPAEKVEALFKKRKRPR